VVPPQKFVNVLIRYSENVQVFKDLQTLLASSGGLLGVSWPRDPWFDSWCDEFCKTSNQFSLVQSHFFLSFFILHFVFPVQKINSVYFFWIQ